jgi:hypothetical protein
MDSKVKTLDIVECCVWCRKPVELCGIACDDAGTYSGILIQGEWIDVDAPIVPSGRGEPRKTAVCQVD